MLVERKQINIFTLGEFLKALESQDIENDAEVKIDVDDSWYDVGYIDSWRGSYDKPALGYSNNEKHTYGDFLEHVKEAQCMNITGWKGGESELFYDVSSILFSK